MAGVRAEFFVLEFVLERGAFSHPFASLNLRVQPTGKRLAHLIQWHFKQCRESRKNNFLSLARLPISPPRLVHNEDLR